MMLTDLADVLRAAGQQVLELPGWQQRGEDDGPFNPIGILLHHDAMALGWNSDPGDDLNVPKYMSQNGVDGSQLWVSRTGLWIVMAAGRKWHAGRGDGWGDVPANAGNTYLLGVETDHTDGDPWPDAQARAINDGCRALVQHYGWKPSNCCGHLEYAPGRKHDPSGWDLDAWRRYLASTPSTTTTPTTVPEEDEDMPTAKEIAAEVVKQLMDEPVQVRDAQYAALGRNPDRSFKFRDFWGAVFNYLSINVRELLDGLDEDDVEQAVTKGVKRAGLVDRIWARALVNTGGLGSGDVVSRTWRAVGDIAGRVKKLVPTAPEGKTPDPGDTTSQ